MKKKAVICIISLLIIFSSYGTLNSKEGNNKTSFLEDENETTIIKVGIVKSSLLTFGCTVGASAFRDEIGDYTWTVGDKSYKIDLTQISRKDSSVIYKSDLLRYNRIKEYDVLIFSGIQDEQILSGFPIIKENLRMKLLKHNIQRFIKEGGGFIGHCGGSTIPIKSAFSKPLTLTEEILFEGYIADNGVKVYNHNGQPVLSEHLYMERIKNPKKWINYEPHPEYIGYLGYLYYNAFHSPCGMPVNLDLRDLNNPIFKGYHKDTLLVRWGCGPSYILPYGDINITNLADYKSEENPSTNQSTRINYWSFNESIPMIKYLFANFIGCKFLPRLSEIFINKNKGWDTFWNLEDWDETDIPIKTDYGNHSALLTFNYPQNDPEGGRVLICGCHPELSVWDRKGKYLDSNPDTDNNSLSKGLIIWKNDSGTPNDKSDDTILKDSDIISNPQKWFVRREVAWAYKNLPDDYYPPVYGRSEVVDIQNQLQEKTDFEIICSVGKEKDEIWDSVNLSLYYRYKGTSSSNKWTEWTLYDSIHEAPWMFNFDSKQSYGNGTYEFYSILNTTNATFYTCDNAPPAADTKTDVGAEIIADFNFNPGTAYINSDVYFKDCSETKTGHNIVSYHWDFGDENQSDIKNPVHRYCNSGTYDVELTVLNDEFKTDQIKKTITVLKIPVHNEL